MSDESKIEDGGSAFPTYRHVGQVGGALGGMSLRDWFAGQVLAGTDSAEWSEATAPAKWAYKVADAMLAARVKALDAEGSE